jgi:5,10-methylenetetrahydromethanopterin reductase
MVEFWRAGGAQSTTSVEAARRCEAEGWDGQMFMDSQSISADPYVLMGAWAMCTERLKLCTSTTNPLTRHPVVTAACAATLQSLSAGRAILGIGRGDSALAFLGYAPAELGVFQRVLQDLQTLLSGGAVAFGAHVTTGKAAPVASMSLSDRPKTASLQWLPKGMPKVPLDVAATGPKVIAMAAPVAERLTFSVGSMPERINWAVDTAREARAAKDLGGDGISYGAQVVVVCHPKVDVIMDTVASIVAPLARFQVIRGAAAGPQNESDAQNFAAIREGYDMTKHAGVSHEKLKGASLSADFVRRFAIVGPPELCIQRLLALHALGIERFVVVGPGFYPEADSGGSSLFVREVIPAVRAAVA